MVENQMPSAKDSNVSNACIYDFDFLILRKSLGNSLIKLSGTDQNPFSILYTLTTYFDGKSKSK